MPASTRQRGDDVTLWVNLGTDAAPDFVMVEGQSDYSNDASKNEVDASAKGDDHDVTYPGSQTGSISVTITQERPDTADLTQAALENSFLNALPVMVEKHYTFPEAVAANGSDQRWMQSWGYLLEFSESASRNEMATYDCSITLNAQWADVTPAPVP